MEVAQISRQIKNMGEQKSVYMHVNHVKKVGGENCHSKVC